MEPSKIADRVRQNMTIPVNTKVWIDCLKKEDIPTLRKLLKKERANLPSKFKRLYKETGDKLENLLHFMRTKYPYFTDKEVHRSKKLLELKQKQLDFIDITATKLH